MSYMRVIPRDLFNEANLLKCYGQMYIELENSFRGVELIHEDSDFDIQMDEDGGLTIANIQLNVRGKLLSMRRPLNSRRPYPLYLVIDEDEEIEIFEDSGRFTEAMKIYLESSSS